MTVYLFVYTGENLGCCDNQELLTNEYGIYKTEQGALNAFMSTIEEKVSLCETIVRHDGLQEVGGTNFVNAMQGIKECFIRSCATTDGYTFSCTGDGASLWFHVEPKILIES